MHFQISSRIRIVPNDLNKPLTEKRRALFNMVESISTLVAEHGESWQTTVVMRVPCGTTNKTIRSICSQVGVEVCERVIRSSYDCTGKSFGPAAHIERGKVQRSRVFGDRQTVIVRVSRSLDV